MRKNLWLTVWLALPILVFSGLVAWIFLTFSRPQAMHATPVGPGAGDTGGANALGEWLAGRDPDSVERANIARREGHAVDPFTWPGGTEVVVPAPAGDPVTIAWVDPRTGLLRAVAMTRTGDAWHAVMHEVRPPAGVPVYLSVRGIEMRIREGRARVTDADGLLLMPMVVAPVVPGDTLTPDPLRVELALPG